MEKETVDQMKKIEFFLLVVILFGAFIVRLYRFNGPVADWHSWRQADTSAVSRNFVRFGFDIFHPRFDDLSMGVSLIDNPKGYRYVEFPFYNILQAGFYQLFDYFTIEEWGRMVSIFASLGSIIFIYLIIKHYCSYRAALSGAFFYAFLPYNVYYSRVLLPDSLMMTVFLGAVFFFIKWIESANKIYFIGSLLLAMIAILFKPFVLFYYLPLLYLMYKKFQLKSFTKWELWVFLFGSIIPFVLWRWWMSYYPEGIPRNDWLFNGNGVRFKGAFFHWIFAERISRLILGYFGLPIVIMGILEKTKKEESFFLLWIVASLLYMTVLATGNVQHDYYQILIIPTLTIFFAKGMDFIFEHSKELFNRYTSYLVVVVCTLFMFAFGWFMVRDYYTIQHPEIVSVGKEVDRLLALNAKVIAPYGGDTTFLYHINRQGWPVVDRSFKDFVKQGATHLVFLNPSPSELEMGTYFATFTRGSNYVIFDLSKPLKKLK